MTKQKVNPITGELNLVQNDHGDLDTSTGEDHTYVGQDLSPGASPNLDAANITGVATALGNLTDVTESSPAVDDILKYIGGGWANRPGLAASAGPGLVFYLDDTVIIPAGGGPETEPLETLSKTPEGGVEDDDSVVVNNNTLLLDQYKYDTALGISSIGAGEWVFNTYTYVDDTSGTTELIITICKVVAGTGTIAITGTGTSRTATVSGSTPFVAGDYNADITQTGHIITPNGIFRIIGYTSTSVVTVETLSTYTNESGVAFEYGRHLFYSSTGDISHTSAALYQHTSIQPAFAINTTDKLAVHYFAKTTNVGNITAHLLHNGTENYSRFTSPLVTLHDEQPGLNAGPYQHLSAAEKTFFDSLKQITAESFSEDVAHATGDANTGKAFTISNFPIHAQIKKISVRADFVAGQQANTGSALVNNASGISPTDTSIAYDNAVADFAVNDYASIDDEKVKITADSGTVLTVTRGVKGTTAAYHDDNATIVKANHGLRLTLFKDSGKKFSERIIELSSMMTYGKSVATAISTDAAILTTGALSGTVTFTNASTAVSGAGTSFLSEVSVGGQIQLDGDGTYVTVASVTNDTALVLTAAYPDAGGAGAATRATDTHFGVTEDIKNVGPGDFIMILDTANELCRVQNVNHDVASATFDYTIFVKDDLSAHDITKRLEKVVVFDLDIPYSSSAGTLYGTLQVDEAIANTVNATIDIETDSYEVI